MKKLEDFTKEDLVKLRGEICLNSVYVADYANSFGIDPLSVGAFMEGYYDYLWELVYEDDTLPKTHESVMKLDTDVNLECWYYCYADFDWVQYVEDEEIV